MKIRLLVTSIILVLIGHVLVFAQSDSALVTLSAPADPVNAGDTFTVTIQVGNATGVYGSSLKLTYDPLALEAISTDAGVVTPGDFFGNQPGFTLKNLTDTVAGTLDYATTLRQPAEPVTGSGILGTIQFRALTDGTAEIAIVEASLLAPRFEEVNGRKIARAVDEVPVQTQNATISTTGAGMVIDATPMLDESQLVEQFTEDSDVFQPWAMDNPEPVLMIEPVTTGGSSVAVIAGIAFFMAGLLLFTMGVGSYVRLHRQLSWQ
jgi:hypothetical protein